jgi:hypothetical protein
MFVMWTSNILQDLTAQRMQQCRQLMLVVHITASRVSNTLNEHAEAIS